MQGFLDFLGFVNQQLNTREIQRLETMLMPANFSSIVGEFMSANIPKYCRTLVKNRYHNGHPDLIPPGPTPATRPSTSRRASRSRHPDICEGGRATIRKMSG